MTKIGSNNIIQNPPSNLSHCCNGDGFWDIPGHQQGVRCLQVEPAKSRIIGRGRRGVTTEAYKQYAARRNERPSSVAGYCGGWKGNAADDILMVNQGLCAAIDINTQPDSLDTLASRKRVLINSTNKKDRIINVTNLQININ